jgi:uncharacterized protein
VATISSTCGSFTIADFDGAGNLDTASLEGAAWPTQPTIAVRFWTGNGGFAQATTYAADQFSPGGSAVTRSADLIGGGMRNGAGDRFPPLVGEKRLLVGVGCIPSPLVRSGCNMVASHQPSFPVKLDASKEQNMIPPRGPPLLPRSLALGRFLSQSTLAMALVSCPAARTPVPDSPAIRWLKPSETAPHGQAPGAQLRLLTNAPDGTRTYALILSQGDEVWSALQTFANDQHVVSAHFSAIGAVRDPEVGWFDPTRKEYKAMSLHEQMEVLMLSGDIALGVDGKPVVHTHVALARSDGEAWGGHLLSATASPTVELYVTTYPEPMHKRFDPNTDLQLIDPSVGR